MKRHCQLRFGVTPQPHQLVQAWRFDEGGLVAPNVNNASYILFTSGLNDGWSVSAISRNLTETVVAVNFPNGAHHSDVSGPTDPALNTDDVNQGRDAIEVLLQTWLKATRATAAASQEGSASMHENLSELSNKAGLRKQS